MKNYIYIPLVALAALLLLQACYEDLGNYDYQAIDEVAITLDKSEYETMTGRITIEPTLVSTVYGTIDANNEDQYTYAWLLARGGSIDTIAHVRQLQDHALGSLPAGFHFIHYRVTNKSTGVFSDKKVTLRVATNTSQGYMLLCDDNGVARLDMASWYDEKFNPQYDILKGILPPQTGPFKIITYVDGGLANYGLASPGGNAIYILSQSGSERVGYIDGAFTYKPEYNIQQQFSPGTCPPGFIAENINNAGNLVMAMGRVNGKGNLYYCNVSGGSIWGNPVNTLDGGATYFSAASQYTGDIGKPWLVFDEDTKSIYQLGSTASACSKISETNEVMTPYTNMGKDLVYMGKSVTWTGGISMNDLKYYIILKDPGTGKYSLLRTDQNGKQDTWREEMDATDIANASCFAVGGANIGVLFYAAGGKVYQYNIADNKSYLIVDKGAAAVTYIGFGNHNRFGFGLDASGTDPFKYMLVASYDGSTGTVGCYNSNLTMGAMWELYKHPTTSESFEWTGFGKVISIAWKAS